LLVLDVRESSDGAIGDQRDMREVESQQDISSLYECVAGPGLSLLVVECGWRLLPYTRDHDAKLMNSTKHHRPP